jgi:hypothetical protein
MSAACRRIVLIVGLISIAGHLSEASGQVTSPRFRTQALIQETVGIEADSAISVLKTAPVGQADSKDGVSAELATLQSQMRQAALFARDNYDSLHKAVRARSEYPELANAAVKAKDTLATFAATAALALSVSTIERNLGQLAKDSDKAVKAVADSVRRDAAAIRSMFARSLDTRVALFAEGSVRGAVSGDSGGKSNGTGSLGLLVRNAKG